jgi:hypothetical protein
MARFDVDQLRLDIEALIRDYPELTEDETLRADMLDAETGLNDALALLTKDIKLSEWMVAGIIKDRAELSARKTRLLLRVELLRGLILKVLQSADLKKVMLPSVTLSQAATPPQIVGQPDADTLPDDLVRIRREPNLTAIREALMERRELPGLSLSNAPPHLVISKR